VGTHTVSVKIDGGNTIKWFNVTYSVSATYGWMRIYTFDNSDPATYIPWESFDIYINGTALAGNEYYGLTTAKYNVTLVDGFGDTVYSSVVSFQRTLRLRLTMYPFTIKSQLEGKVIVYVISSGGGNQSAVLFWGSEVTFWLWASKTYQVRWQYIQGDNRGLWGQGWHYYPSLDTQSYRTPSDDWYAPTGPDGFQIDEFGISYLYDSLPPSSGGGGTDPEAVAQAMINEMNPFGLFTGTGGRLFLLVIAPFVALAYLQYHFRRSGGYTVLTVRGEGAAPSPRSSRTTTTTESSSARYRGRNMEPRYQPRDRRGRYV